MNPPIQPEGCIPKVNGSTFQELIANPSLIVSLIARPLMDDDSECGTNELWFETSDEVKILLNLNTYYQDYDELVFAKEDIYEFTGTIDGNMKMEVLMCRNMGTDFDMFLYNACVHHLFSNKDYNSIFTMTEVVEFMKIPPVTGENTTDDNGTVDDSSKDSESFVSLLEAAKKKLPDPPMGDEDFGWFDHCYYDLEMDLSLNHAKVMKKCECCGNNPCCLIKVGRKALIDYAQQLAETDSDTCEWEMHYPILYKSFRRVWKNASVQDTPVYSCAKLTYESIEDLHDESFFYALPRCFRDLFNGWRTFILLRNKVATYEQEVNNFLDMFDSEKAMEE